MRDSLGNWLFHLAALFGSAVYVLIKPDKKWHQNVIKFAIGYVCAMFSSHVILSIFQYFFGFSGDAFDSYLPATGFVTGVLGMTFYEAVVRWIRGDMGSLLTEIIKSWLKRKE